MRAETRATPSGDSISCDPARRLGGRRHRSQGRRGELDGLRRSPRLPRPRGRARRTPAQGLGPELRRRLGPLHQRRDRYRRFALSLRRLDPGLALDAADDGLGRADRPVHPRPPASRRPRVREENPIRRRSHP